MCPPPRRSVLPGIHKASYVLAADLALESLPGALLDQDFLTRLPSEATASGMEVTDGFKPKVVVAGHVREELPEGARADEMTDVCAVGAAANPRMSRVTTDESQDRHVGIALLDRMPE